MSESNYLKLARTARSEGNSEDAKRYYDRVREEDPSSAEAKYFYAFYALHEGTNGELPSRFLNLCKVVLTSVKMVSESNDSAEDKVKAVAEIVASFTPETWAENRYMNHKNHETKVGDKFVEVFDFKSITTCGKQGMMTLKELGDLVASLFDSVEGKVVAAIAWKEYVSLSQKWYSWAVKGDAEAYAAKIKEVVPGYEMPKKAGCISLADSKE